MNIYVFELYVIIYSYGRFSSTAELPLCGHGAISAAYVLYDSINGINHHHDDNRKSILVPNDFSIYFHTSSGFMLIAKNDKNGIGIEFPAVPLNNMLLSTTSTILIDKLTKCFHLNSSEDILYFGVENGDGEGRKFRYILEVTNDIFKKFSPSSLFYNCENQQQQQQPKKENILIPDFLALKGSGLVGFDGNDNGNISIILTTTGRKQHHNKCNNNNNNDDAITTTAPSPLDCYDFISKHYIILE